MRGRTGTEIGPVFVLALLAFAPLVGCSVKPAVDARLGVAASPKVIDSGKPVPKGGGREQVGKPYKVAGKTYRPTADVTGFTAEGLASWYGSQFHGRLTANGEIFDKTSISAAHPSLPLPSYARVTNLGNGKSIVVRVNDRGPFHGNRSLDVSERTAELLDFKHRGMAKVRLDYIGPASLRGSDDGKLLATFRDNGVAVENLAVASLAAPATPAQPVSPVTPAQAASRIDRGFAGIASPQPLTQRGGAMVEPVLSGFAFDPGTLSGLR